MKTKNPIKHRSPNSKSLADPKHRQRVKPDKRGLSDALLKPDSDEVAEFLALTNNKPKLGITASIRAAKVDRQP